MGLITGCFDILHQGHFELFIFAKKHSDILIVGLENDESIRLTKGETRPFFTIKKRKENLLTLKQIDYIFVIDSIIKHTNLRAKKIYQELINNLSPTYLITNPSADRYWKNKHYIAKRIGGRLLLDIRPRINSTTQIAQFLAFLTMIG